MFKRKKTKSKEKQIQSWEEGRKWLKKYKWEFSSVSEYNDRIELNFTKKVNGITYWIEGKGESDLEAIKKVINLAKTTAMR